MKKALTILLSLCIVLSSLFICMNVLYVSVAGEVSDDSAAQFKVSVAVLVVAIALLVLMRKKQVATKK
jgi:hypothetical protein